MRDNEFFWFMPTNGRPPAFLDIAKAHYFSNLNAKVFNDVDKDTTSLKSGADKSTSKSGSGWSMSGKGKGKGISGGGENDDGVHDALLSNSGVDDEDEDKDVRTGRERERDSRKERDREREREKKKEKMREGRGRGSAVTTDVTADLGPVSGISKIMGGSFLNCPASSSVILRSNNVSTNGTNSNSNNNSSVSGNGINSVSGKESVRDVKEMSIFSIIGYGSRRSE